MMGCAERYLLSGGTRVLHHVIAPLKLRQVLLQLEIRVRWEMLLLLRGRGAAILVAVHARRAAHGLVWIGVGRVGRHPDRVARQLTEGRLRIGGNGRVRSR
jgi:hypothetical protein